jgi:hypothetical protein
LDGWMDGLMNYFIGLSPENRNIGDILRKFSWYC